MGSELNLLMWQCLAFWFLFLLYSLILVLWILRGHLFVEAQAWQAAGAAKAAVR